MKLLIDAGNSAVKWRGLSAGAPLSGLELHRGSVEGLPERLKNAWRSMTPGSVVVGCSVAGPAIESAIAAVVTDLGGEIRWQRSQDRFTGQFALENGYRDPLQLGADRWHAMVGACSLQAAAAPSGLVVVMAGTATTADCVIAIADGFRFIGGCIAPGVRLMTESLARQTAGLPLASGSATEFPDHTDDAIATGVADAQAGLVQRVVGRLKVRSGDPPMLVIGGGHAEWLGARLREAGLTPSIADNLVLTGLALR